MPDDPLLTTAQAAEQLGCDGHGLPVCVKRGWLTSEPKAWGKRIIDQFRKSAVDNTKPLYKRFRDLQATGVHESDQGKQFTLKKAAEVHDLPLYLLRQAVDETDLLPE